MDSHYSTYTKPLFHRRDYGSGVGPANTKCLQLIEGVHLEPSDVILLFLKFNLLE